MEPDVSSLRLQRYFRHPDHETLKLGDRAVASINVRRVMAWFDLCADGAPEPLLYDDALKHAVEQFQRRAVHFPADGTVGPGTRALLVEKVLEVREPSVFLRLDRTEAMEPVSAFFSYATADKARVEALESCVRAAGFRVIRDDSCFIAGLYIDDNIVRATADADKVVAFYSAASRTREWPLAERELAESIERRLGISVLIYVQLDDAALPPGDHRLAIRAAGKSDERVCREIVRALQAARGTLV